MTAEPRYKLLLKPLAARLNLHPQHLGILRGLVTVTVFLAIAKVVAGFKEMAVAARYGVSPAIDSYVLLTNLINWPVAVWTSTVTTALVPLVIKTNQSDPGEAIRFKREAFGLTLALGLVGAVVTAGALNLALGRGWLGAAPSVTAEAIGQTPVLSATFAFGLAYGLLSTFLMAGKSYANSLLDGVQALVILMVVAVMSTGGSGPLIWATAIGLGVQVLLCLPFQPEGGRTLGPVLALKSPLWGTVFRGAGLVALGQVAMSGTAVLDQLFAAKLGAGANATLGYAIRLTALVISLGTIAVSRALLPALSGMTDRAHRNRVALQWTGLLFIGGCVAALLGWVTAGPIIDLLYRHGRFTAQDAQNVKSLFQYSLVQIPFYIGSMGMVQLLASAAKYKFFSVLGVLNFVVKIIALALMAPTLGMTGIVLSTAVMYLFSASVLTIAFLRETRTSPVSTLS